MSRRPPAASAALLAERETELDEWEAELVRKQQDLDSTVLRFRDEMASALNRLASKRREVDAAVEHVARRERAVSRAEADLRAREQRLMACTESVASAIRSVTSDSDTTAVNDSRPPTAAARNDTQGSSRSGPTAVATAPRHTDPMAVDDGVQEDLDLGDLVVQGSVVMTAAGHILSPQECAELLVRSGAFEEDEMIALTREGYSATAMLVERLGVRDERPSSRNGGRPRGRTAPSSVLQVGSLWQMRHGFDDDDEGDDEGDEEEHDEDDRHLEMDVVNVANGNPEFDYADDYDEEEEEEEEEEEPNISLH
jgi:hypothetical protein